MTAAHLSAMGEAAAHRQPDVDGDGPGSGSGKAWPRPSMRRRPNSRSRCRRARATSTAERWPRCSRGCGPTDLVWRYWVNNYLQGRSPAPFDVLFWNADTTRMPAALHREMVMMGLQNALAEPGAVRMLGTPVDLGTVTADTYVIAGVADHISPWQACYRSARMLGSKDRAVHPVDRADTSPRWSIRPGTRRPPTAQETSTNATRHVGRRRRKRTGDSWWPDFSAWLAQRGGEQKPAPTVLGGDGLAALGPAPGSYVHER